MAATSPADFLEGIKRRKKGTNGNASQAIGLVRHPNTGAVTGLSEAHKPFFDIPYEPPDRRQLAFEF